jgi:hypothetical protein
MTAQKMFKNPFDIYCEIEELGDTHGTNTILMRTKTLLLAAALTAVGIATSMAQVYSVNAVGYVRTTLKPGFNMISNPLLATSNKISDLFKNVDGGVPTEGFALYKYNGTGYDVAFIFDDGSVDGVDFTLAPGEGAFVQNSSATAKTITFVGEVPQNTLTTTLHAGFQIVSSQVPQAGTIVDLGYKGADQDTAYQFDATTQAYKTPATLFYDDPSNPNSASSWDPAAPNLAVGEAFWLNRLAAGTWTRTFSVNATQ